MGKKVGIVLSGCGVYDGSEIHEAVLTLLYLDKAEAEIICMAPDMDFDVVNHLSQEKAGETRNTLIESARIARGEIKDIKDVKSSDLDAVIFPGGFGAAKNLSNFAEKGPDAVVHPEVERILNEMAEDKKPVGAICIAPATIAKALSGKKPEVTIGSDQATASGIEGAGGTHFVCAVNEIHVDQKNKIVTTPAYMLGPGIKDIAKGIEKLVNKVVSMA